MATATITKAPDSLAQLVEAAAAAVTAEGKDARGVRQAKWPRTVISYYSEQF